MSWMVIFGIFVFFWWFMDFEIGVIAAIIATIAWFVWWFGFLNSTLLMVGVVAVLWSAAKFSLWHDRLGKAFIATWKGSDRQIALTLYRGEYVQTLHTQEMYDWCADSLSKPYWIRFSRDEDSYYWRPPEYLVSRLYFGSNDIRFGSFQDMTKFRLRWGDQSG